MLAIQGEQKAPDHNKLDWVYSDEYKHREFKFFGREDLKTASRVRIGSVRNRASTAWKSRKRRRVSIIDVEKERDSLNLINKRIKVFWTLEDTKDPGTVILYYFLFKKVVDTVGWYSGTVLRYDGAMHWVVNYDYEVEDYFENLWEVRWVPLGWQLSNRQQQQFGNLSSGTKEKLSENDL
jgi:hypothetical protein